MISESESKEILEKFVENNGMLKEYPAQMAVPGDMAHKRRVLEYLEGWGLIESFNHMDWKYYSITKKGLRLIDRLELEEKAEKDSMDNDKIIVKRHETLLEEIGKHPGISTTELKIPEEHYSTTHNRLKELLDWGKIRKEKIGVKNVYYLIDSETPPSEIPKESPNNAEISYGSTPDTPADSKPEYSPGQLKIIDEIPEEHAQILVELFKHLPDSWTQFEGRHNNGKGIGYLKVFVEDVDECVDYYNKLKECSPEKPKLDIHYKNRSNYVKIPLLMGES